MNIDQASMNGLPHRLVAVLLHFRTPDMTLRCLTSLWSEQIPEVVLLDNSEDDGASLVAVKDGLAPMQAAGFKVHFLDFGRNLGFAAGVNRCIGHAMEFGSARVLLINSDAQMTPGSVARLDMAISAGVDVAYPTVLVDGHKEAELFYQRHLALLLRWNAFGSTRVLNGVCMLLSERVCSDRLFDESFFFYGEDVELSARFYSSGVVPRLVIGACITHKKSVSAKNGSFFYEYHMVRGHCLLALRLSKNKLDCIFALAGRCITLPLRSLIRSVKGCSLIPMRALCLATADFFRASVRLLTLKS